MNDETIKNAFLREMYGKDENEMQIVMQHPLIIREGEINKTGVGEIGLNF